MENPSKKSKIEEFKTNVQKLKDDVIQSIESIKEQSSIDLTIDDVDLDAEVLRIPKIYSKYLNLYTDQSITLKDLMVYKDKIKMERWKYYSGKQTEKYQAEHGVMHEKVIKSDIDMYLASDEKYSLISDLVNTQKIYVDMIEKVMKGVQFKDGIEVNDSEEKIA